MSRTCFDASPAVASTMTDRGLAGIIARHARATPHRTALHFEGADTSYGELWRRIEAATLTLQAAGVKPGDRVAWLGLNHPAMLVLLFALARLGAMLLPLNYRLAPAELRAILAHAGADVVVADEAHRNPGPIAEYDCRVLPAERFWPVAIPQSSAVAPDRLAGTTESPVLLVYTSGTTGKPRGAVHTQAGLLANCLISGDAHAFTADDHVLTALPMFHVGGLCIQTLPALYAGARVTVHARFDAGKWLGDVQRLKPSTSVLVPATLRAVLEHADFAGIDLSSLRLLNTGSSTIPATLIAGFHARGVPVCQVYGSTETGPVSIYLRGVEAMAHAGSAGKAGLNVDVRLVDANGQDVPPGTVGEVWVRAPNVMQSYWNDADNPAFQDGWFKSGDLARCDENGFYWVVGRSKDMIISGGENIYPAELENLLADCPDILDAAVIGQPDERWGEVAVAVVVKKPGAMLEATDVMALFIDKLARFKHPRRVIFADALPKTALGKVQKPELADWCSGLK